MASPSRLCRLCSGRSDGVRIFTDSYADVALDEKIYFTVDIKVHKTDVKQTLCTICRDKVLELFEFKRMCKNTESLEKSKKEFPIPNVKIKLEPGEPAPETLPVIGSPVFPGTVTPSLAPTFTPSSFSTLPNGAAAMMTIMIDQAGNYVHMPMVPVGPAVPLPMLKTLKLNKENENDNKKKSDVTSEIDLKKVKLEKKEENDETHNDNLGASESLKDDKTDNVPDDEKEETVDEIISQISTDKEDEIEMSDTRGPKVLRKTRANSGSGESSTEHTPIRSTPGRARRGRKRRGSFLPQHSGKRRRGGRIGESTRTPVDDNKQGSERRLTRSSAGMQPRRKIVDSDSGDGDFDPDDPDDPEFSLKKKQQTSSSSSSSSSAGSDDEKKKAESKKEQLLQHVSSSKSNSMRGSRTKDVLRCRHCFKTFNSPTWLEMHEKTHTIPKLNCAKCEKPFSSYAELEKHEYEAHANETWHCYDCLCGFSNLKSWKNHKRNHCKKLKSVSNSESTTEPGSSYKCSFCSEKFNAHDTLTQHLKVHFKKPDPSYPCKQCDEVFPERGALICHVAFHHPKNPNSKSNLSGTAAQGNQKENLCTTCNENFDTKSDLICHQSLHHKKTIKK